MRLTQPSMRWVLGGDCSVWSGQAVKFFTDFISCLDQKCKELYFHIALSLHIMLIYTGHIYICKWVTPLWWKWSGFEDKGCRSHPKKTCHAPTWLHDGISFVGDGYFYTSRNISPWCCTIVYHNISLWLTAFILRLGHINVSNVSVSLFHVKIIEHQLWISKFCKTITSVL